MLDTHARNIVQPILDRIARVCLRAGISANGLTVLGMLVGVCAALLVAAGHAAAGVAVLWLSGTIDAADGTLARLTRPSALGAILDITLDRVVEIAMILAIASRFPNARFELILLSGIIAIAMSLFLSIGAAVTNLSVKSFHYAPGLGERTEAFICLSLMVLDSARLLLWTWVFIAVIVFTMAQRLHHAWRLLSPKDQEDPVRRNGRP
ncbi:MAG: CDP-alcohol phosphatidyltransferase family protein [Gammaproteobacteria bacterium]